MLSNQVLLQYSFMIFLFDLWVCIIFLGLCSCVFCHFGILNSFFFVCFCVLIVFNSVFLFLFLFFYLVKIDKLFLKNLDANVAFFIIF